MPSVASISVAPLCRNGQSGAIAFLRWERGERAVVLPFWPITNGWRACWGRKQSTAVSSAFCRNSPYMEKRFSGIPTVNHSNTLGTVLLLLLTLDYADTGLCSEKVVSPLCSPKGDPVFKSPRHFRVLHTQNLLLSEYHKWLPDVGQQLTLYPHTDFFVLWKPKNLLYERANFPAQHCSRVDNKPLDTVLLISTTNHCGSSGEPATDSSNSSVHIL